MNLTLIVRRGAPLLALIMGGCAGLFHSTARPEQIYYLRAAVAECRRDRRSAGTSLRVAHPMADPGLDTPHIMLRQPDHRMSFYAGSRWPSAIRGRRRLARGADPAGLGHWTSVEDSASPFPSDYLLQITCAASMPTTPLARPPPRCTWCSTASSGGVKGATSSAAS